jgi:hypothetical protein
MNMKMKVENLVKIRNWLQTRKCAPIRLGCGHRMGNGAYDFACLFAFILGIPEDTIHFGPIFDAGQT